MARRAVPQRSRLRRLQTLAGSIGSAQVEAYGRPRPEATVGRTVRIVAEGDSWFSYVPPTDVLACLRKRLWDGWRYDVADRAKAGATLNDMVYGRDPVLFFPTAFIA